MKKPFKYHLRPGYGSDELLLEFFIAGLDSYFTNELMVTLQDVNPRVVTGNSLWMDEEILWELSSDAGPFSFSKDFWGYAFIMVDKNQLTIMRINELLINSELFEKEEVIFEKFKNLKP